MPIHSISKQPINNPHLSCIATPACKAKAENKRNLRFTECEMDEVTQGRFMDMKSSFTTIFLRLPNLNAVI